MLDGRFTPAQAIAGRARFLRKISDGFVREERERQERAAKEELQKQYEAAAQFMTAYSSQQAPEVPKEAGAPQPETHQPPAPRAEAQPEAPAAEKAEAPRAEPQHAPAKAEAAEAGAQHAPAAPKPEAQHAPAGAEAPKPEAQHTPVAPKAPERPKFVPGIRVVQTKAEVEASEEARRRQLAQQRQQRQANPQGPYGRPANPSGPYGRPANPSGPYGRPANPQGPYGRPANPQGPYGPVPPIPAVPMAVPRAAGRVWPPGDARAAASRARRRAPSPAGRRALWRQRGAADAAVSAAA